jgi:short-subunit dehydrogenase
MNFADQKILVLGASGVLGSNFVEQLSIAGAEVFGTASSTESLSRIPSAVKTKFELDLMKPNSITKFCEDFISEHNSLNGIIVSSGVVGFGQAELNTFDQLAKLTQINHVGPAQLISSLFPALKESGNSFVLGITGVVVEQVFPGMSVYTSSKMAHSGYLQSIQKEWRRYKVHVVGAHLPHTETGLAGRAAFGTAPQMPTGLEPRSVVTTMLQAVIEKKNIIPSTDFS